MSNTIITSTFVSAIRCARSNRQERITSKKNSKTVRSSQGEERGCGRVRASNNDQWFGLNAATAVFGLSVSLAQSARASELTEKLAGFLDAVDAASETVAKGVSKGAEFASKAKDAYDEAVPVVQPYAERALEAAKPIGAEAGKLAQKYVAPVADDVIGKVSEQASGVYSQASGALKSQGVDVGPVVQVVESTGKTAYDFAVPISGQVGDYLSNASAGELGLLAIELYVAYLILPGVFGILAGASRGYAGDVRALEAYEMILSGNTNVIDLRSQSEKSQSGPNPPKGRVLEVDTKGESVEVTALKVSALNGVGKGKKYVVIGGDSKGFAKALKNKGYGKVFVLKGGYGAWKSAGLP